MFLFIIQWNIFLFPSALRKKLFAKEAFLSRFLHFLASYIYFLVFHPSWWGPSRILTNVSFTTAAKFDWALRSSESRANWLINNYTHLGFIFYVLASSIDNRHSTQHVCRPTHFSISQVNIYLFVLFCHQGWQQRELLIKFRRRCRPPRAGAGPWWLAVCNTSVSQQY